jgi:hypothetical protein
MNKRNDCLDEDALLTLELVAAAVESNVPVEEIAAALRHWVTENAREDKDTAQGIETVIAVIARERQRRLQRGLQ